MTFYVGLDLGQKRDHSAVAIVERMPLGTPYPKIVARVKEIVQRDELRGHCALAVDATGVGAPVVDMLRAARVGCDLTPVTITGGDHASGDAVPKRDLLAGLQVLLESGELKIGRMKETAALVKELVDVRISMSGSGRVRMGADGTGQHDDLVIALALACWRARRMRNGDGTRRLPGI